MRIGIAYDTSEMYNKTNDDKIHFDFADLASINQVKKEFQSLGCEVELIGGIQDLIELLKNGKCTHDLIYNTVEGINSRNREGLVPAILEANNVAYMGTDSFGVSLSLNKVLTKILANHLGILSPLYCVFKNTHDLADDFIKLYNLNLPVIVKPNLEGNSSGISVCYTYENAQEAILNLIESYETDALCEEFIYGKEITIPVIGNCPEDMLWGITTVDNHGRDDFWLDVKQKVYGDYKNEILNVSSEMSNHFKELTFKLFETIGCRDFARFDFRLSSDNKIFFIEANPLPCLFKGGSFDIVGRHFGYTYAETLKLILNTSCERLSIPKI